MSFWPEIWTSVTLTSWQQALPVGLWFGALHALDADHLATIGGLAVSNRSLSPVGYAARWSLGHGVALALIAVLVFGLGAVDVADWTAYAELAVCVALLAIGAQTLRMAWTHVVPAGDAAAKDPSHLHSRGNRCGHGHRGIAMGLLHGGAGSSAVLAVLPLGHFHGFDGAVYVVCFSVGVTVGALAFAGVFASCVVRSNMAHRKLRSTTNGIVGAFAIAIAIWLLKEILSGGS